MVSCAKRYEHIWIIITKERLNGKKCDRNISLVTRWSYPIISFNRTFASVSTSIIPKNRDYILMFHFLLKFRFHRRRADWIMRNFARFVSGSTRVHVEFVHEDTNTFFYFSRPSWANFAQGLRSARRYTANGIVITRDLCMRGANTYIPIYICKCIYSRAVRTALEVRVIESDNPGQVWSMQEIRSHRILRHPAAARGFPHGAKGGTRGVGVNSS